MALAPKFAGQAFATSKASQRLHSVELYLDYVCPFSARMFNTVYSSVLPSLSKHDANVEFILRQQIQPWHPSSTLVHEAAAAVLQLSPENFWPFSAALFERQKEFFDVNVVNECRNETYRRLVKIAGSLGIEESKMLELLTVKDKPAEDGSLNIGNGVTNDIKMMTKFNRRVGVHVTPTVLFNGIEEQSISSGFTSQDWENWLAKNAA